MRPIHLAATSAVLAATLAACADTPTAPARPRAVALSRDAAAALAIQPARDTLWVRRGGRDSLALRIARPEGLADSVAIVADSVTAGLTARVAGATLDTTATLVVAASADVAPGAYRIPLHATAGANSATSELTVVVHTGAFSGPGGGSPTGPADATWTYGDSATAPVWVGYQEGDANAAWTRVTPRTAGDTIRYDFTVRGRGAVAVVTPTGHGAERGYELAVYYGTAAELAGFGRGQYAPRPVAAGPTKRLTGSIAGGGMLSQTTISLGTASASVAPMQSAFTLRNVQSGPQDLVAALSTFDIEGPIPAIALSRLIIRRGVDLADGSAIPTLDFGSAEAFAPASPRLEVTGATGVQLATSVTYQTAGGGSGLLSFGMGGDRYFGVPRDKQVPGDMHMLTVLALPPGEEELPFGAGGATGDGARAVFGFFAEARDRTIALGPELATATVAPVGGGAYPRWRAAVARQAEYGAGVIAQFTQEASRRHVTVTMTEGYVGDAAAWELAIPDLAAAEGFDATWAPSAGAPASWLLGAYGGDFAAAFAATAARGGMPEDGTLFRYAMRAGTGAPAAVAMRRSVGRR